MTTTMTASCLHCGFNLSGTHTGPCPNCGKVGKQGVVVANEIRQRIQSIEIVKLSRKEQIKRRPSIVLISIALFVSSLIVGQIDHDFSFIISLILATLGFAPLPLKEKIIHESKERYRS